MHDFPDPIFFKALRARKVGKPRVVTFFLQNYGKSDPPSEILRATVVKFVHHLLRAIEEAFGQL